MGAQGRLRRAAKAEHARQTGVYPFSGTEIGAGARRALEREAAARLERMDRENAHAKAKAEEAAAARRAAEKPKRKPRAKKTED